jgi:hypothetical protein
VPDYSFSQSASTRNLRRISCRSLVIEKHPHIPDGNLTKMSRGYVHIYSQRSPSRRDVCPFQTAYPAPAVRSSNTASLGAFKAALEP